MSSQKELKEIRAELIVKAEETNNPDDWVDVGFLDSMIRD